MNTYLNISPTFRFVSSCKQLHLTPSLRPRAAAAVWRRVLVYRWGSPQTGYRRPWPGPTHPDRPEHSEYRAGPRRAGNPQGRGPLAVYSKQFVTCESRGSRRHGVTVTEAPSRRRPGPSERRERWPWPSYGGSLTAIPSELRSAVCPLSRQPRDAAQFRSLMRRIGQESSCLICMWSVITSERQLVGALFSFGIRNAIQW